MAAANFDATPPSLRLFYALWPDAATRAALTALQTGLAGRPTPPEQLHLTLAFLGSQPASQLPMLSGLLAELPAAALPLRLNRNGYFPRQQLAWIGPEPAPAALLQLQQQLSQALQRHLPGYRKPHQFLPHVTLARKTAAAPSATATVPIDWRSSAIVLVGSLTEAQGARYQVLASQPLPPAAATAT